MTSPAHSLPGRNGCSGAWDFSITSDQKLPVNNGMSSIFSSFLFILSVPNYKIKVYTYIYRWNFSWKQTSKTSITKWYMSPTIWHRVESHYLNVHRTIFLSKISSYQIRLKGKKGLRKRGNSQLSLTTVDVNYCCQSCPTFLSSFANIVYMCVKMFWISRYTRGVMTSNVLEMYHK